MYVFVCECVSTQEKDREEGRKEGKRERKKRFGQSLNRPKRKKNTSHRNTTGRKEDGKNTERAFTPAPVIEELQGDEKDEPA